MASKSSKPSEKAKAKAVAGPSFPTPCRTGSRRSLADVIAKQTSQTEGAGSDGATEAEASHAEAEPAPSTSKAKKECSRDRGRGCGKEKKAEPNRSRQISRSRSRGRGEEDAGSEQVHVKKELEASDSWVAAATLQKQLLASSSSRRPQRNRLPVLETWRNQRAVYTLREHGLELVGCHMPDGTKPKVVRPSPSKQPISPSKRPRGAKGCSAPVKVERLEEVSKKPLAPEQSFAPEPETDDEESRPQHRLLEPQRSALRSSRAKKALGSISFKEQTETCTITSHKEEALWTEPENMPECNECFQRVPQSCMQLDGPGSTRFSQWKVVCFNCKAKSYMEFVGGWTMVAMASREANPELASVGEGPVREYMQRLIELAEATEAEGGMPEAVNDVLVNILGKEVAQPAARIGLLEKAEAQVSQMFGGPQGKEGEIEEEDEAEVERADVRT